VSPSNNPGDASNPAPTDASPATREVPNANARIIKRYSNRKLYDTVESRYVTLPQIAELLRKGEDVRIIDNNSKEDLTSVTLAQILYEEERKQSRALPLAALKDLIHTSGEKIITSLRDSPMGKLIGSKAGEPGTATDGSGSTASQQAAPEPVPAAAGAGKDAAPGRLAEMLESSKGSLQEWQHRVDERVRKVLENLSPASQVEKLQIEVRRLGQRIEELEAKLGHSDARKDEGERR
jgi:polyhydroxyalkanoate synthesis repressor PhaR